MTTSARVQIVLLHMLLGMISAAEARAPQTKAERIVAAAKLATGGAAWDTPEGCTEHGTHQDGAVTYQTRFSLRHYGMRIESERGGATRSMGFNGTAQWQTGPDGTINVRSDQASVAEAIVTNYLSINGFFFPDRFPASFTYLRAARENGRRFDVVEMTPSGGRALEVWFDRKSHLIARVVDPRGTPPVTVEASDYRRIDGLSAAYQLNVIGPDGTVVDRGVVTSFSCGSIDPAVFDPPG